MTVIEHLIKKRLSKAKRIGRILARLPFVRAVILNGSLASGNHKPSSDIDILIIAKDGRVFTARFFVNFIAIIFHLKRSKDDKCGHAGKFCFNYFLTENYLHINYPREREMYCAGNYSKSQFVAGDIGLFKKFMKENKGLFEKYCCEVSNKCHGVISTPQPCLRLEKSYKLNGRTTIKRSLHVGRDDKGTGRDDKGTGRDDKTGSWFEKWAKEFQVKKIESDPRTQLYPNMIVYNDRELRFHPPKRPQGVNPKS